MIAAALLKDYPSSTEADVARREMRDADRRRNAIEERKAYDARYAAEMAKLSADGRAQVSTALATIRDSRDFQRVEEFLSTRQGTFFGGVALHAMIDAVQRGVLPPSIAPADREKFARDLTARLHRDYPDDYWSRRAQQR